MEKIPAFHATFWWLFVDADTKIEWTTDYQLSSVESTQAAERKLFQVPATREVVEDLGCEEGSMYVRQVFGHPYHPLDKLGICCFPRGILYSFELHV